MKKLLILLYCILLLSGCNIFEDNMKEGFVTFRSTEGRQIYVSFIKFQSNESTDVRLWNGDKLFLEHVCSASGAKFSNGKFSLWFKGDEVTLYFDDEVLFMGSEVNKNKI